MDDAGTFINVLGHLEKYHEDDMSEPCFGQYRRI